MNVTRLFAPSGMRIDLTDDEAKDLLWVLWEEGTSDFATDLHDAIYDAAYRVPESTSRGSVMSSRSTPG